MLQILLNLNLPPPPTATVCPCLIRYVLIHCQGSGHLRRIQTYPLNSSLTHLCDCVVYLQYHNINIVYAFFFWKSKYGNDFSILLKWNSIKSILVFRVLIKIALKLGLVSGNYGIDPLSSQFCIDKAVIF